MVFFFAIVCSIRSNQQQQTSVLSSHSLQPCCVSSMMIVCPFSGVAFHRAGCGSAFLCATENVRAQAAQLTLVAYSSSSAQCLLYNAVIGVGAKLNLFAKFSAKFGRAVTASKQFCGSCLLCMSFGSALHSVRASSSHFVANPFAACARVRVWYCWQRICIRTKRISWTCLVSFRHCCGCVAQVVISTTSCSSSSRACSPHNPSSHFAFVYMSMNTEGAL